MNLSQELTGKNFDVNKLETIKELRKILEISGIRAALQFLNGLSTHRFTALYRFDDKLLKNMFLIDKKNLEKDSMAEIPVLASYCVFVRDSGRRFCVENSLSDSRTIDHPKRQEILAYCGFPLLDQFGKMFGTICHFDVAPRGTSAEDIELMEEMANLLQN